jgi:hypothetical protein
MDIQALLDEVTKYGQEFNAEHQPRDFEDICVKLVMNNREYFNENFLDHLAEMKEENMHRLHKNIYTNYDDVKAISGMHADDPLGAKMINTFSTSCALQGGQAIGFLLETYQTEVIDYVSRNMSIWWDDLRGYVYDMEQRDTNESLVRDGEI